MNKISNIYFKAFLLSFLFWGLTYECFGQILTFDFAGLAGNEATANSNTNNANLSSSTISRGSGITAASNADRFGCTGFTTGGLDVNDYVEFTITPNGGFQFEITSIVMQHQRSGTGPVNFAIRSSLDAYASNLATAAIGDVTTIETSTFTFTQSNNSSAVTYRIYGYTSEAETGTWGPGEGSGNDIVVNGTVTSSCTAPSTSPTSYSPSSIAATTMTVGWTRGDGNNVLVLARAGGAVNADPTSGTSYTANAAFGSGTQIGTGNYVIYDGSGTSVNVTGLTTNTTYHYAIYEYNTTGTCYLLTELTGNSTTLCDDPGTQATLATFSNVVATSMTIGWTVGNGSNHIVLVKSGSAVNSNPVDGTSYTANTAFGSGTQIGTGNYVVYNGTGTSVNITGLSANTTYHVAVYEFNSTSNCYQTASPAINNTTTTSAASDIVAVASSEAATISSLINTASPLTSAQGTQVWQFTIRDGGAGLNDPDALPTLVTAITFAQAAGNSIATWTDGIEAISIFDGTTNVGNGTVTATQVQFTGLNISVADGTSKTITVRLTVKCPLGSTATDGDDFGFSLTSTNFTTASSGSSQKSAFSAITSTNSQNVIAVVATLLSYTTQPSNTGQSQLMSPSVVVKALDACGNVDLGFTGNVSISSSGTLTGDPVTVAAVAGAATFSSLTHTVIATGLTLTASSTGLTSVVSNTFDITVVTIFAAGDIAIVGMCVNMNGCQGSTSAGEDEVSFVSFEDITPGTTIDLTDNGFERKNCGSNTWGNTEGVIRLTRTSSTIAKGTVVTIRILDQTLFSGVQPDNNWTVSYPNSGYGTFNMNNNDEQIYIMQGGTWNKGTSNTHDATYVGGTLMFGINTYTSWTCNDNTTTRGDLPLAMKCFSILPGSASQNVKYSGATTAATQKDWIDRLNSPGNWTGTNDCATYVSTGLDYGSSTQTFTIDPGGFNAGSWTGALNTDWFDCNNWQNYKIPDSTTNVIIDNQANDPVIGAPTALYPSGAFTNDITITNTSGNGVLTINNASSQLTVKGNWANNGTLTHSNGLVRFRGDNAQSISGTNSFFNFYNHNLSSTGVTLSNDITISNDLKLIDGTIITGANKVIFTNTSASVPSLFSNASFINGTFRRNIATNASVYQFPLGDGNSTANYKRIDLINNNLTGTTYVDASVTSISESGSDVDGNLVATQGAALTNLLSTAIWTLIPDIQPTGGTTYGVRLYVENVSELSATDDNKFCPVKRDDASTTYADWSTYWVPDATVIPNSGAAGRIYNSGAGYAERTGYTSFSKHAIAKSGTVLPVKLLLFEASQKGKTAVLHWATAQEENSNCFEIERSLDATKFIPILKTNAAGYSNGILNYQLIDERPLKGNNYYRLKETDFDGKFEYSEVRKLNFEETSKALELYQSGTNLIIKLEKSTEVEEISLFDVSGRLVESYPLHLNEAGTYEQALNSLSSGIYLISAKTNNGIISQRIIVK